MNKNNPQSEILESLQSAFPWLEQAYSLVQANNSQTEEWAISIADALHYCTTALSEITQNNQQSEINSRCPCFAVPKTDCRCIPQENVACPNCLVLHIDLNEWALKPHKTHLCQNCGSLFEGTGKAVSNPTFTPDFICPKDLKFMPL